MACTSGPDHLTAHSIAIFKNTEVWNLAKAIEKQDTVKIKLLANKSNIDFQDSDHGFTLLHWAVFNDRYNSAKVLAELGANPNIQSTNVSSAFVAAAKKFETPDYLKLLIKHGGDVNAVLHGQNIYTTPLFAAANTRLENVQLLVNAGANVSYVSPDSFNAIIEATLLNKIDIIRYLIIDCHADFKNPPGITNIIFRFFGHMEFLQDSPEYKVELDVLQYMKENGADYWEYRTHQEKEKEEESITKAKNYKYSGPDHK